MKVSKSNQIKLSLFSVVLLAVLGVGFYLYRSSNFFNTSADELKAENINIQPVKNAPVIAVKPDKDSASVGDELSFQIIVDPGETYLTSAYLELFYPSDILEFKGVDDNGVLSPSVGREVFIDSGKLKLDFAPLNPVNKSGVAATVKFKALKRGVAFLNINSVNNGSFLGTLSAAHVKPVAANGVAEVR